MVLSTLIKLLCIGWVGGVLLVGLFTNGDRLYSWVGKKFQIERDFMLSTLDLMFVQIPEQRLSRLYGGYLIFLFVLGILMFMPNVGMAFVSGLAFTAIGWKLPGAAVRMAHKRRTTKFVLQMVDGLSLMSNALRSGLNIPQALQLVSDELSNPISQEFTLVLSQNKLGISLEEAMGNLTVRMPHDDIEMFTTSVNILKETGGNLAETFDSISFTIRERIKIESKIAAMVSQGVLQGIIVVLMPFALGGILYTIDPERIAPMFTTIPGWVLLMLMMTLQAIGGWTIWKIVQVRV